MTTHNDDRWSDLPDSPDFQWRSGMLARHPNGRLFRVAEWRSGMLARHPNGRLFRVAVYDIGYPLDDEADWQNVRDGAAWSPVLTDGPTRGALVDLLREITGDPTVGVYPMLHDAVVLAWTVEGASDAMASLEIEEPTEADALAVALRRVLRDAA